ncbi:hypothetical protein SAMN05660862_2537 [Sphingobacterium psychroaquaticum]|uniref:Uncharacterized protein n=2 Tax=Sphingobacterium psychroaquaticum TaxID=561061 RepID=A0A1X7K5S7_9SPHI|nr:hypothetical protein SAMN05660862_2537 [Sphingobacterium psychroaquaticum]
MIALREKPTETLAKIAKYTPWQVERKFEAYLRASEELDSLQSSERYFEKEYPGNDRDKHLAEIRKMIGQMESIIAGLSCPRTIGRLCRENMEMTIDFISLLVNDLRRYLILDRMITDSGIQVLSNLIVSTYPALTLEEIAVCFAQAKKGFYGEDYQRLDGSTVMKWLRLYIEDKHERLANKHYSNEVQYKAGKEMGRSERGESLKVFLDKATGAVLLMQANSEKK